MQNKRATFTLVSGKHAFLVFMLLISHFGLCHLVCAATDANFQGSKKNARIIRVELMILCKKNSGPTLFEWTTDTLENRCLYNLDCTCQFFMGWAVNCLGIWYKPFPIENCLGIW